MTLYLLKVHLQTFLSIPISQKCQILSCDTIVANEPYDNGILYSPALLKTCNFVHFFFVEYEKRGACVQYSETLLLHIWEYLTE
jgi:hypothetical protein